MNTVWKEFDDPDINESHYQALEQNSFYNRGHSIKTAQADTGPGNGQNNDRLTLEEMRARREAMRDMARKSGGYSSDEELADLKDKMANDIAEADERLGAQLDESAKAARGRLGLDEPVESVEPKPEPKQTRISNEEALAAYFRAMEEGRRNEAHRSGMRAAARESSLEGKQRAYGRAWLTRMNQGLEVPQNAPQAWHRVRSIFAFARRSYGKAGVAFGLAVSKIDKVFPKDEEFDEKERRRATILAIGAAAVAAGVIAYWIGQKGGPKILANPHLHGGHGHGTHGGLSLLPPSDNVPPHRPLPRNPGALHNGVHGGVANHLAGQVYVEPGSGQIREIYQYAHDHGHPISIEQAGKIYRDLDAQGLGRHIMHPVGQTGIQGTYKISPHNWGLSHPGEYQINERERDFIDHAVGIT